MESRAYAALITAAQHMESVAIQRRGGAGWCSATGTTRHAAMFVIALECQVV